jgi:hypothetical protein
MWSVVRTVKLWKSYTCEKPVPAWLLCNQLISLIFLFGYDFAHFRSTSSELLPIDGNREQRRVSFWLLVFIFPLFLASDLLGIFWIFGDGVTGFRNAIKGESFRERVPCWADDYFTVQIIAWELVVNALFSMAFAGFALSLLYKQLLRRSRPRRDRWEPRNIEARRQSLSQNFVVPIENLLRHCPEAQCNIDCTFHCSICMEDCKKGDLIRTVEACGHQYHSTCLEPWLRNRPTCPNCNQDVRTPIV